MALPSLLLITMWTCNGTPLLSPSACVLNDSLGLFFLCSHPFVQKGKRTKRELEATQVTRPLPFISKPGTTGEAVVC